MSVRELGGMNSVFVTENMIRAKTNRRLRCFVQMTDNTKSRKARITEEQITSALMELARKAESQE